MNKWEKLKIEDVCEFIGGSQPPKSTFIFYPKAGYTRLVQTRDFKTDKFPTYIPTNSTTKFFSKEDIIIGRYGPPIFQIFRGTLEGAYNVALMKAVPKKNILNTFLYYFLTQNEIFEYVDKLSARTGGQTGVDLASLYKYPIYLPSKDEQKKIASVLSALDSKIELNNRINAQLEAMAKTLYDYWFVQFDFPISADQAASMGKPNLEGKPYKSSGGKMVWNEELKREIPEGWEVKKLGDYANIKKGVLITEKTANTNGNIKVVSAGLDFSYFHSESNYPENTITISASGASAGFINFWREPIFACDCTTVRGTTIADTLQILGFLRMRQDFIYKQARGSAQPHVYPKDIEGLSYPIPPRKLVENYGEYVNAGNEKIAINIKENQQLASLRDWLLPMLMNGQVTVGGAPKVYDMPQQQVSMVAEQQALFDSSPIKQAVDLQLAMVLKALNRKKGDTMMQKDAYNLLALNGGKNPFLKAYNYVMNNFGTYSEQLKKDINNNPYIIKHTDGEKSHYWLNPETENEVKKALKAPENQEFVRLINWLKELYAKPFINNNFDRIELMNTVLKIVAEYQTKDPKKVYEVMKTWKVELGKYKTKAQKFTFKETETMLNLMINKGVVK